METWQLSKYCEVKWNQSIKDSVVAQCELKFRARANNCNKCVNKTRQSNLLKLQISSSFWEFHSFNKWRKEWQMFCRCTFLNWVESNWGVSRFIGFKFHVVIKVRLMFEKKKWNHLDFRLNSEYSKSIWFR